MPRKNLGQLDLLILNLLTRTPQHAYGLRQLLEQESYQVALSTLYYRLRDLQLRQLITSYWVTQAKNPAKLVYKITPKGRAVVRALTRLLQSNDSQSRIQWPQKPPPLPA